MYRGGAARARLRRPAISRACPHRASDSKGGANDGRQAADQGDARADHGGGPTGIDMRLDNRVRMPALILKRASASISAHSADLRDLRPQMLRRFSAAVATSREGSWAANDLARSRGVQKMMG